MKITSKIAELVGLHTGDGTLYMNGKYMNWELRGGLNEKEFYINHLTNLLSNIFKIDFKPKFRSGGKNGCFGFQISKKLITHKFIDLGFNPGPKCYTVRIPSYIFEGTKDIKLAYIRGLFDTDGCFRFEIINNKPYPKIEFCSASVGLIYDLKLLLTSLEFKPYTWGKKYSKLCVAGHSQFEDFLSRIKPANPKHLKRVQKFRLLSAAAVA